MAKTIQLDIATPERHVYNNEVEMVIVPAIDGDLGVLPNHAPLMTALKVGIIRVKVDGEEKLLASSGGFMEVKPDQVTILSEATEFPEEIDLERAREAKRRAKRRLEEDSQHINEARAEAALQRAINRIKLAKGE
ncbi:F0F1 ATP synthase subunit epsilon [Fuchsiella alkaliacetigena]|uniref:F0F1 ATP synthase subunit epsilon n=1 Tax=Fuchsiella alkaliacetigena TaxID=957042 RepID=UPI00200AE1AF|nr:F0F1 ATP synthase subunit epsilon [Fuchsiella alkaliacetigena]MCK8824579.1 F0F1 ATP synthase subunit epsilon [Fuchsiella alkaliacetigena]